MHRPILHIHDIHCNADAEFFPVVSKVSLNHSRSRKLYLLIIISLTLFVVIKIKVKILNQHEALKCQAVYSHLKSLNINQKQITDSGVFRPKTAEVVGYSTS